MKIFCAIILLSFAFTYLGTHLAKHGEPTGQKYNFWVALLSLVIDLLLLWGAGVFDCFIKK